MSEITSEFALMHKTASVILGRIMKPDNLKVYLEDDQLKLAVKYCIPSQTTTMVDDAGTVRLYLEFKDGSCFAHRLTNQPV